MRRSILLSLLAWSIGTPTAQARLFWQTYGAVVPTASGECTWNVNQDYFVPRYPTTGRYGLFSPCKTSCTTSPACKRCHPLYPGYCTNYGPLHYCWRNHLYHKRCGCVALPMPGCTCANVTAAACYGAACCCEPAYYGAAALEIRVPDCHDDRRYDLPNVEVNGWAVLGEIPSEDGELLAAAGLFTRDEVPAAVPVPIQPPAEESQIPSLGRPEANYLP